MFLRTNKDICLGWFKYNLSIFGDGGIERNRWDFCWASCLIFQSFCHFCELDMRMTWNTPVVIAFTLSSELCSLYMFCIEWSGSSSKFREGQACEWVIVGQNLYGCVYKSYWLCLSSGSCMLTKTLKQKCVNKKVSIIIRKTKMHSSCVFCSYWMNTSNTIMHHSYCIFLVWFSSL